MRKARLPAEFPSQLFGRKAILAELSAGSQGRPKGVLSAAFLAAIVLCWTSLALAESRVLDAGMYHLRLDGDREWSEFLSEAGYFCAPMRPTLHD